MLKVGVFAVNFEPYIVASTRVEMVRGWILFAVLLAAIDVGHGQCERG